MISYEDKIKSDNLNNYFAINEQKLVIKEIKHLKVWSYAIRIEKAYEVS